MSLRCCELIDAWWSFPVLGLDWVWKSFLGSKALEGVLDLGFWDEIVVQSSFRHERAATAGDPDRISCINRTPHSLNYNESIPFFVIRF